MKETPTVCNSMHDDTSAWVSGVKLWIALGETCMISPAFYYSILFLGFILCKQAAHGSRSKWQVEEERDVEMHIQIGRHIDAIQRVKNV